MIKKIFVQVPCTENFRAGIRLLRSYQAYRPSERSDMPRYHRAACPDVLVTLAPEIFIGSTIVLWVLVHLLVTTDSYSRIGC